MYNQDFLQDFGIVPIFWFKFQLIPNKIESFILFKLAQVDQKAIYYYKDSQLT